MGLSRADVEKVSLLARLALSDDEIDVMAGQLAKVLDYMQLLEEADVADVEPMAHAADVTNVFRPDEVKPSLPREQALANAPNHDGECYRVPAVLGDL
ncbi:MAG: Asp-tRNA(Asn)/Glu-tRNA(Gln) amidotransferase subunit GatC [Planctomycetota bacterium]|nr:MAG: Asp-tRNA(Asn)/Glu-tRNA(Gln) amidotransferase subunit GatC [Planctomycetota bacterium]